MLGAFPLNNPNQSSELSSCFFINVQIGLSSQGAHTSDKSRCSVLYFEAAILNSLYAVCL